MTSVENPLTHKCNWCCRLYLERFLHRQSTRNRAFSKIPQSRKVQQDSRKVNGKGNVPETRFWRNATIQQDPGRFQEEKREAET